MKFFHGLTLRQAKEVRLLNRNFKKRTDPATRLQCVALVAHRLGDDLPLVLKAQGNAGWPLPLLAAVSRSLYAVL